jgi:hypothetical protein
VTQRLIHNAARHIKAGRQAVCAVNTARAGEFRIDHREEYECGRTSTPKLRRLGQTSQKKTESPSLTTTSDTTAETTQR